MSKPHAPRDLHGNAPDQCEVALLLVDVINDLEFEGGDELLKAAAPAAAELAKLKRRADHAGVPVIYANDNFGRWRSDFSAQVRHVCEEQTRGKAIAKLLAPTDRDYFVLKPKHSAFYETCLGLLLEHLGARQLVIGGFATDSCVQLTANDAYLRGFGLLVLSDGTATQTEDAQAMSLAQMRRVLHAQTPRCSQLSFEEGEHGAKVGVLP
jgi:nicotinamidase-related amidase